MQIAVASQNSGVNVDEIGSDGKTRAHLPLYANPSLGRSRVLVIFGVEDRCGSEKWIDDQSKCASNRYDLFGADVRQFIKREVVEIYTDQLQLAINRIAGLQRIARRQTGGRERKLN